MKIFKFFCLTLLLFFLYFLVKVSPVVAAGNSFVTVVNPIRGADFWDLKSQKPIEAVAGQMNVLRDQKIPATWLIRIDALNDQGIVNLMQNTPPSHEKGLFLEVTPTWTKEANVNYRNSSVWHFAESVFLTGYEIKEREKLVDAAFEKYKNIFGNYPKSVGAWYIDSYSLDYMQKKYKISAALIVADQYTTDNYQIWGQYFEAPYYPTKNNTLIPAQNQDNKIPVVITQWAARDPVNGYGDGVQESTYSVQANDYLDYHNLDSNYFSKLVDIYTTQPFNRVNQLVVGLENSYDWSRYLSEYQKQMEILSSKQRTGQFNLVTMSNFATYYQSAFSGVSPTQTVVAQDPLGTNKKAVWFMNPFYRSGWFDNVFGSVIRDLRQYTAGQEEPCMKTSCKTLNFATFATRVLDDVTYKQRYVLDLGKISNFSFQKKAEGYLISYTNEAKKARNLIFMERDISIDGKVSSIDGLILETIGSVNNKPLSLPLVYENSKFYQDNILSFSLKTLQFLVFLILGIFLPGFLLVKPLKQSLPITAFLSVSLGMVMITVFVYLISFIKAPWLVYVYLGSSWFIFIWKKYYLGLKNISTGLFLNRNVYLLIILLLAGTIFQSMTMIRSGWVYDFGIGFFGPTGHDGIWHQALISELTKNIPPANPGFAGTVLSNYHYFFDLLVAISFQLSQVPILDLLYRFYPVLFSLMLGVGTYLLVNRYTNNKWASLISVYFAYFAGSFGWMVEYIKQRHFGGESAFWVNQPVSMNLNPPFAISLVFVSAVLLLLNLTTKTKNIWMALTLILIAGSLIEFKVYAGVIVLTSLAIVALWEIIKLKDLFYLKVLVGTLIISAIVFLPQNNGATGLLVFAPFWFIHSMIDLSDRVGWERLSLMRQAGESQGIWWKFLTAEFLGLMIFIIGNLGLRFIALFSLIAFIKNRYWLKSEFLFIFIAALISLMIPIFFIQKGNSWNTIQFNYYFLYLVTIFTGPVLYYLYKKLPKIIGIVMVTIILLITPINAFTTFKSGLTPYSPARLTIEELAALNFLSKQPEGTVLTPEYNKDLRSKINEPFPLVVYETNSYVSAFTGKPVYLEDEIQQEILQNSYLERAVGINEFFQGRDQNWSKDFLTKNDIRYVYVPKLASFSFNPEDIQLKSIFKNSEAEVFEVSR